MECLCTQPHSRRSLLLHRLLILQLQLHLRPTTEFRETETSNHSKVCRTRNQDSCQELEPCSDLVSASDFITCSLRIHATTSDIHGVWYEGFVSQTSTINNQQHPSVICISSLCLNINTCYFCKPSVLFSRFRQAFADCFCKHPECWPRGWNHEYSMMSGHDIAIVVTEPILQHI